MNKNYYHKKHFSVAEAIQVLYTSRFLIEKMSRLAKNLISRGFDLPKPNDPPDIRYDKLYREFEQLLEVLRSLESTGMVIKKIEEGLVDFPHIRGNGEEVYLCYQAGESTLQYWHTLDAGYAGRQPIQTL